MPKGSYKILNFSGGLNTNSEARDLLEGEVFEFAEFQGFSLGHAGKLILGGKGTSNHETITTGTVTEFMTATSFFIVNTDYSGYIDGAAMTAAGQVYFLAQDGSDIHARSADDSEGNDGTTSLPGVWTHLTQMSPYLVNGNLRIYDANTSNFVPQWRGYVKQVTWGAVESDPFLAWVTLPATGWQTENAQIKGCFPEIEVSASANELDSTLTSSALSSVSVGRNLIAGDVHKANLLALAAGLDNVTSMFGFANEECFTGTGPNAAGLVTAAATTMKWGSALEIHPSVSGNGTWAITGNETYQFYATTMFDEHNQESEPQLFTMLDTYSLSNGGGRGALFHMLTAARKTFLSADADGSLNDNSSELDFNGNTDTVINTNGFIDTGAANVAFLMNGQYRNSSTAVSRISIPLTSIAGCTYIMTVSISNYTAPIKISLSANTATNATADEVIHFSAAIDAAVPATSTQTITTVAAGTTLNLVIEKPGAENNAIATIDNIKITDSTWNNQSIVSGYRFMDGDSTTERGTGVGVTFSPICKWVDKLASQSTSDSDSTTFNFGAPAITSTGAVGNTRISGLKYYWASSEDGYSNKYLLMDWYFKKGIKPIGVSGGINSGTGGYIQSDSTFAEPHQWAGGATQTATDPDQLYSHVHGNGVNVGTGPGYGLGFHWDHPPIDIEYSAINQHGSDEVIVVDSFKASALSNGRMYIGNVQHDGIIYGDRIYVSPSGQYDKFPEQDYLQVGINDGDEIISLQAFADRLLVFKKNKLYIINTATYNDPFIELEQSFKGLDNPGAVCRSDFGIIWVNFNGAFIYDGEKVVDLLDRNEGKEVIQRISQATWKAFFGGAGRGRAGYDPLMKNLIVSGTSNHAYVYSFLSNGWSYIDSAFSDTVNSNMLNDPLDGKLLFLGIASNKIKKWVGSGYDQTVKLTTKDIDFGEPGLKKTVFSVNISYKGIGGALEVFINRDGKEETLTFNTDDTPLNDAVTDKWTTLVCKPTVPVLCNSFGIRISGVAEEGFEINDITIIYRLRGIR